MLKTWTVADMMVLRYMVTEKRASAPEIEKKFKGKYTLSAITAKISDMGLQGHKINRYKPGEKARIAELYVAHKDWDEIQAAVLEEFQTFRSIGTLRNLCSIEGLRRDRRKQQLINRYGHADTMEELEQRKAAEQQAVIDNRDEQRVVIKAAIEAALRAMKQELVLGVPRPLAFRKALDAGASLQHVGDEVGLTRERVRQIVSAGLRERGVLVSKLARLSYEELDDVMQKAKAMKASA